MNESKVGKRYIIEIAEEYVHESPRKLYKDSLRDSPEKLYRIVGFKSLVLDDIDLSKLDTVE